MIKFYTNLKIRYRSLSFPYQRYLLRNKCIFIHVPKTAGTSILYKLGKRRPEGRVHLPWYVYEMADSSRFKKFYKFAFVRNPWDRAYSTYRYLLQGGNGNGDIILSRILKRFNDFDDFVINGLGEGQLRNHQLFIPQSEYIVGSTQELMVDFVGRFENLKSDFREVSRVLGLNSNLPQRNMTSATERKKYYDAYRSRESIEIIRQIYKQDVQFFCYEF